MQTTAACQRRGSSRRSAALGAASLLLIAIACSGSEPTAQEPVDLTMIKVGPGTATIVSSPAGLSCGSICLASFDAGTVVTLSVTVAAGSAFTGWSGACGGTGTCVVTMDRARTVAASLVVRAPPSLNVNMSGTGGGTVTSSPAGISCTSRAGAGFGGACDATFAAGSTVTVTAKPDSFSVFAGWIDSPPRSIGVCRGTSACTLTMDTVKIAYASFQLSPYLIRVSATGTGTGTVTSSPAGISCPSTCSAPFPPGTRVTLHAAPDASSDFTSWSGACSGTGSCIVVAMDGPKSVGAAFTQKPPTYYKLTVSMTGEGVGGTWLGELNYHGTYCFSYSPPSGVCEYSLVSGKAISLIVWPAEPYGTGTFLKANPGSGSYFSGWTGACTGMDPCTVIMNGPKSVGATFALNPDTLIVKKSGTGTGTVVSSPLAIRCPGNCTNGASGQGYAEASTSFVPGTMLTLSATPDAGSVFTGWSGDCTGTGTCTVTMTATRNVTATFTSR
jgi:uncharacterized repeat protein (TIGR02543 family)